MDVDGSNNVYISGVATTSSVSRDFLTIKYTSGGTQSWASLYDHQGYVDMAVKVRVSGSQIISTGAVQVNSTTWAIGMLSYNISTGTQNSLTATILSSNIVFNEINGFTTDASDNTYIVGAKDNGANGYDYLTIKVDASLSVVWSATWNGSGGKDVAKAVAVDGSGRRASGSQ